MNTALHEIYTTKFWNILPESVQAFRKSLEENISSHRTFNHEGMPGLFLTKANNFDPQAVQYVTSNPEQDIENPWCAYINDDDEFINLVYVNGGITRNAACGFGSKAQRDQVLYAAKKPNCIGHIFLIDTPGGSALSIGDYADAINSAKEAGQPVIACIDGLCASAGYALACQCDAIYYSNPNNIVGCIGTMAIFTTNKNGDTNSVTQEVYHEIYDPESTEKNIESRMAAEGDDSLILEQLAEHGKCFRDLVTKCRPNVKEEQLKGKTYKCSEAEGTLVDAQHSLQDCIDMLCNKEFSLAPATPATVSDTSASEEDKCNPNKDDKCAPKKQCSNTNHPQPYMAETQNINSMAIIDENIQTALVETQAALADKETALAEAKEALATAKAEAEELNAKLASVESALAEKESAITEATAKIESLTASIAEKDNTIAEVNTQVENLNSTIAEKDTTIAEHEASITDLQAQLDKANADIEELAHTPSDSAVPTAATATEGEGDGEKQTPESACASKEGMTIEERRAAQKARDKALGIL